MSTSVEFMAPLESWAPPATKPFDEAVWRAWLARGRAQDRQSAAIYMKAAKWASLAALLAADATWSHLAPFDVVVRFIVTAGAIAVACEVFPARHYTVAAVFGSLALLYNPVAPILQFAGGWQRVAVLASAILFGVSLNWSIRKTARND